MRAKAQFAILLLWIALVGRLPGQWNSAIHHSTIKLGANDSIDLDTLSLQESFPIVNKAGRGAGVRFAVSYHADFWSAGISSGGGWTSTPSYGWNFSPYTSLGSYSVEEGAEQLCNHPTDNDPEALYTHTYQNRTYTDPLGIQHVFAGTQVYSECTDSIQQDYPKWTTTDGYSITANFVYDPAGNQVALSLVSADRNGNLPVSGQAYGSCPNQSTFSSSFLCDTLGQPVLAFTGIDGSVDGSPTASQVVYAYQDASGSPQTITIQFTSVNIKTNFGNPQVAEANKSGVLIPSSITYPDGTYTFGYEATPGYPNYTTGRLTSVQLPTGGTVTYSYGNQSPRPLDGSLPFVSRTVDSQTTTYTKTPGDTNTSNFPTTETVVVAPPAGNATTYSFGSADFTALSGGGALYLPSSISDGVTLKQFCYVTTHDAFSQPTDSTCQSGSVTGYGLKQRQTRTQLDNQMFKTETEDYDVNGMVVGYTVTDFAQSNPATLSKTLTQYCTSVSAAGTVCGRQTYDGQGRLVASETAGYDEYPLTPTTGLQNRFTVFGDRMNQTTSSVWDSGTNTWLTSHTWYDDAGQVTKRQDENGNFTVFSTDSNDAFVTGVTLPAGQSGVTLSIGMTHDPYSGLLSSQTDPNGHTTLFSYDASLRESSQVRDTGSGGDGGSVGHSYPSPSQMSITAGNGNGGISDVESFADSFGRSIRSAVKIANSSTPWVLTDTCYDANGRPFFKSLPYGSTSNTAAPTCSGSGDTYAYDGVGRLLSISHGGDGSKIEYIYKGRATEVIEEDHNGGRTARIMQMDGLGRLSAVCELTAATLPSGTFRTPVLCNLDIDASTATGFVTSYDYTSGLRTLTATQSGQVRMWVNDSLGRLVSETIPEAYSTPSASLGVSPSQGVTTFAYSNTSAGLQVIRQKPRANQFDGTVLTTTITQFDQLGRLASVTYDDGTPSVNYSYDVSLTPGRTQNMKGRLSYVTSSKGTTYYSYTSNGQIYLKADSHPNAPCTYVTQEYHYDLLGQLTTFADNGSAVSVANSYDNTGNPSQLNASIGGGAVAALLSSISYGALGITSLTYGNGWTGQVGYDTRGRVSTFTAAGTGGQYSFNLTWASNGSLQSGSDFVNGAWNYRYDDFNRLISATQALSGAQSQTTYQYDVWGNRYPLNSGSGGGMGLFTYDAHNHNSLFSYDAAGNAISTPQVDSEYDAEGRVIRARPHGGTIVSAAYVYGPEGNRTMAVRGSQLTEYFYSSIGELVSTWVNGAVVKAGVAGVGAYVNGTFHYEFHDWNGTTRLTIDDMGNTVKTFVSDAFGASSNAVTSDLAQINGLDVDSDAYSAHAGARDYYPMYGSWNAPDPYGGSYNLGDPQTLNRYAYVGNSPVSYNDPSGLARFDDAPDPNGPYAAGGAVYGDDDQAPQPAAECNLCGVYYFLRTGFSLIGSFLNSGGVAQADSMSGFEPNPSSEDLETANNAESFSRFAAGTEGQIAFHPAQTVSTQGQQFIKMHETFGGKANPSVYLDSSGNPTIGFGHLVQKGEDFSAGLKAGDAERIFQQDLAKNTAVVRRDLFLATVPQNQFDVLVDLAFNSPRAARTVIAAMLLGVQPSFYGFKATLPHPNAGLLNRRYDEFSYFTYGRPKQFNIFH